MAEDFTADLSVRATEEAARRTRIVMEQAAEAARTSEAQACATADKCLVAHLVKDKVVSKRGCSDTGCQCVYSREEEDLLSYGDTRKAGTDKVVRGESGSEKTVLP